MARQNPPSSASTRTSLRQRTISRFSMMRGVAASKRTTSSCLRRRRSSNCRRRCGARGREPHVSCRRYPDYPMAHQRRRCTGPQRLHSQGRCKSKSGLFRKLRRSGTGVRPAETARELYLFFSCLPSILDQGPTPGHIPSGELYQIQFETLQNPADGHFLGVNSAFLCTERHGFLGLRRRGT